DEELAERRGGAGAELGEAEHEREASSVSGAIERHRPRLAPAGLARLREYQRVRARAVARRRVREADDPDAAGRPGPADVVVRTHGELDGSVAVDVAEAREHPSEARPPGQGAEAGDGADAHLLAHRAVGVQRADGDAILEAERDLPDAVAVEIPQPGELARRAPGL